MTHYHTSLKRKSLLERLEGVAVHDYWKPYFQLEGVSHALCNAHHLRELNALIDAKENWGAKDAPIFIVGAKMPPSLWVRRTGHSLLIRLRDYCGNTLCFLTNPIVPFTKGQAERDIRMVKCKQKISVGFRTEQGAKQFARIRSYLSTAKKQGWNLMTAISKALAGNPLIPA